MYEFPENFEGFVCEIHDRFLGVQGVDESWRVAQKIVADLGGTALNVAVTSPSGGEVSWARSSMSDAWLKRYEDAQYYLVDPFLKALLSGVPEIMVNSASLGPSDPAYHLNQELKLFGYTSLFATSSGSMISKARSLVVFCSDVSLSDLDRTIGFDRLRVIHAIIAAHIIAPEGAERNGFLKVRSAYLTSREGDVLCWLASGLRNDEIAFELGIAEVTVRKHLLAIRRKLGASTREQAIAIAVRDGWITP